MIKDENYYTVHGWMLRMDLKGYELPIYAIIYGFSQDGKSEFSGSQNYLAEFANCARNTVVRALKSLEDKGFISKRSVQNEDKTTSVYYKVTLYYDSTPPCTKMMQGLYRDSTPPCTTIVHNNKYTYISNNKEYSTDLQKAVSIFETKIRPLKDQKDVDVIQGILDDYGLEYFEKAVAKVDTPSKRRLEYIEATAKGLCEVGDFAEIKAKKQGGNLVGLPSDKDSFVKMFGNGGNEDADN